MTIIIPGKPIPLARARHGNGKTYDSQKQEKLYFGYLLKSKNPPILTGPLHLTVAFYMPIPTSWSLKKQHAAENASHLSKPDLSNLVKFVEDASHGILFTDDAQITSIAASKWYSAHARTELTIRRV